MKFRFSMKTVLQIGIKIIDIFQNIHEAGFIYNDLKLDNIMIGYPDRTELSQLRLIDFGFADKYKDKSGKHFSM